MFSGDIEREYWSEMIQVILDPFTANKPKICFN